MKRSRWLCAVLITVLAWGPLGLPTAVAQVWSPPPGPACAPIITALYEPTDAERVRAEYLNVVYVPGKAILCGVGVMVARASAPSHEPDFSRWSLRMPGAESTAPALGVRVCS